MKVSPLPFLGLSSVPGPRFERPVQRPAYGGSTTRPLLDAYSMRTPPQAVSRRLIDQGTEKSPSGYTHLWRLGRADEPRERRPARSAFCVRCLHRLVAIARGSRESGWRWAARPTRGTPSSTPLGGVSARMWMRRTWDENRVATL